MFAITVEPAHGLMRIRVDGFWDTAMMATYRKALMERAGALAPHGGCRAILVDMSEYPIQAQEIAEAHARLAIHGRDIMGARVAVIMSSSLSRLQAKRIAKLGGRELFDDEPSARAWLLAGDAAPLLVESGMPVAAPPVRQMVEHVPQR